MTDASPPVAVVTGASSGIGAATARALAATGTTVVAVARRAALLDAVVEDCRATAPLSHAVVADLCDLDAARGVVDGAVERCGRLDALVCVAGMPMRRRLEALRLDDLEAVMRLNFTAPVAMTLAALPTMLARRQGTVVLVSSLVGRLGNGGEAAYCASKFALCGFAESAAVDLAGTGVEVRLILPGPIDTAMWDYPGQDRAAYEGERFAPELVADAIVAALSSTQVEHYVPDLKAIVELKTADYQGFRDGMVAALQGGGVELPTPER